MSLKRSPEAIAERGGKIVRIQLTVPPQFRDTYRNKDYLKQAECSSFSELVRKAVEYYHLGVVSRKKSR